MNKKLIKVSNALLLTEFKHIFRVMKLTSLFGVLCVSSAFAINVNSQSLRVNIHANQKQAKEVIKQIEEQTDYLFVYNHDKVNLNNTVTIQANNETVAEVLNQMFAGTDIIYAMQGNNILLMQKDAVVQQSGKVVTGTIVDPSGMPVIGANVMVKGTTNGTITDMDGKFSLEVEEGATLQISYIGYANQEIKVGNQKTLSIALKEDAEALDELVVVGYGTQSKYKVTGAIATVSKEDLSGRQVRSVEQMLQGKMPGVVIRSNSGKPGDEGLNILIRGKNSFGTDSSPLVLIDGVYGDFNSIAPENIENISVMKDAASAAIYGSRAANGVILVTTKKGKAGKLNIGYSANLSTQYYTSMPETITDPVEYMELWNRAARFSDDPFVYKDEWIDGMRNGTYKGYDYTDNIFQHAFVHSHSLNLNGGNEKYRFNMGLNYLNQPGIIKKYNYERLNFLINIDAKINNWLSVGGQINVTRGITKAPSLGDFEIMVGYYNQKPTTPPKLPDGRWASTQFPGEYFTWGAAEKLERGQSVNTQYFADLQSYIKIEPLKGLEWETKIATKYNHIFSKTHNTGNHAVYVYSTGELTEPQNPNSRQVSVSAPVSLYNTLYSTLNYSTNISEHHIDALAGLSIEEYTVNNVNAGRSNYATDNLGEIDAGDTNTKWNGGNSESYSLRSFFARIDYDFAGKYLLQANIRGDESSRFPKGKRLGVFPSFSAGWRVSQEDFLNTCNWLSDLKLKASWGELGNQNIGTYPYQETYSLGQYYPFNDLSNGALQNGLKNQNLTWEKTSMTNVGFDLDIKHGLFTMSVDYFYKLTSGILRGQQVTALVGLGAPTINNGSMSNKGVELSIGHTKQINEKLNYWINGNIAFTKNKLVDYGAKEIGGLSIREEGKELDAWYMYEFDGVYQTQEECNSLPVDGNIMKPGMAKFKDQNGDNKITSEDRTYVGHRYPKATFGVNLGANYRNFDFSVFFQGVLGLTSYQNNWGISPFIQGNRPSIIWRDAWTPENRSNTMPAIYVNGRGNVLDNYASTFYMHDASYLRLKNFQLGYNVPRDFLTKLGIESSRVYISGENIFTITKFPGQDPERNLDDTTYASYPQIKSFSLGLSVQF